MRFIGKRPVDIGSQVFYKNRSYRISAFSLDRKSVWLDGGPIEALTQAPIDAVYIVRASRFEHIVFWCTVRDD